MAKAINKGWDFIKVEESYQYKEFGFTASVKILEDNSSDTDYRFKARIKKSNNPDYLTGIFVIHYTKDNIEYLSENIQLYENEKN